MKDLKWWSLFAVVLIALTLLGTAYDWITQAQAQHVVGLGLGAVAASILALLDER